MKTSDFNNDLVSKVSDFLQKYMKQNHVSFLSADECADVLANNNILTNKIGPKKGFNFRQMLRDGRDKKINLVTGASQKKPNTKWVIYNVNN